MLAVVMDFETTGLTLHPATPAHKQPKPIEAGFVLIDEHGGIVEELSLLINPKQPLDPIITKITGLTDEDLLDKPVFAEVLPQIRAIMSKADLVIAHNLPFDEYILQLALEREGVTDFPWPQQRLCTVQAYQEQWGRRPKMLELYEELLGRPLAQTHRALDDCHALVEIVIQGGLLDDFNAATTSSI